jgi:hypothetical protein
LTQGLFCFNILKKFDMKKQRFCISLMPLIFFASCVASSYPRITYDPKDGYLYADDKKLVATKNTILERVKCGCDQSTLDEKTVKLTVADKESGEPKTLLFTADEKLHWRSK